MSELIEQIEKLVTPALEAEQVELVDLTYGKSQSGWTMGFFLDKPGGITLADCEVWSDRLGTLIENAGIIERSYVLEVSSPGIDRALRKTKDFQRFAGQRIHAKLFAGINGQKNFHGMLQGGDDVEIRLRTDEGQDVVLPRTQVAKVRLDPKIDF